MVRLKPHHSREAILIIAGQPIFSAAYYANHPFDETTLEPPLGSGAYKVGAFDTGHFISFDRVPDYWGKDLPVNVGQANFDRIRFEYFGDRKVAFEAFKAGVFTFREEFTSAVWATGYDFAAVKDGRIIRATLPDESPMGTQGWFLNIRRDKFKDVRIRQAIGLAFDFEWTNANIMYGVYARTTSYFQNSPMAAQGSPVARGACPARTLSQRTRSKRVWRSLCPAGVGWFGPGSRAVAAGRRSSSRRRDANVRARSLTFPDGKPFEIEFLDFDNALEPHTAPFIKNLKLLGIEARYRVVDAAQYKRRLDDFDYDVVTSRFGFGLTPGEGMRVNIWIGSGKHARLAQYLRHRQQGGRRLDRKSPGRRNARAIDLYLPRDRPHSALRALLGSDVEQAQSPRRLLGSVQPSRAQPAL